MADSQENIFEMSEEDIPNERNPFPDSIQPSLHWPQIIHNPKFIGSRIRITSLNNSQQPITYDATVLELSNNSNNEMAIILKDVLHEGTLLQENVVLAYNFIKAVTLIDSQPKSNNTSPITEINDQFQSYEISSSPEAEIEILQNNSAQYTNQTIPMMINVPYLDNYKVDLFYLEVLHKLEGSDDTFANWSTKSGIESIIAMNSLKMGIPLQYEKMDQTLESTIKIKEHWINSFQEHQLSFDNWYMLTGNKIYQQLLKTEFQTEPPNDTNLQRPGCSECLPNIFEGNIPMKLISKQFSLDDLQTNNTKYKFDLELPTFHKEWSHISWGLPNDANLKRIHFPGPIPFFQQEKIKYITDVNVSKAILSIKEDDFLPNGKFAWLYIPSYLHIPVIFLKEVNLYDNVVLHHTTRTIIWIKLQSCRKLANCLLQNGSSSDLLIQKDMKPTLWHLLTSKKQLDPNIKPNTLDHVQHWSAWQYYKNAPVTSISIDDIYDLFIRPIEPLFGFDRAFQQYFYQSLKETGKRMKILEYVAELTGTQDFIFENFCPHILMARLSEIRHLKVNDLLNNPIRTNGPLQRILPIETFIPNENEPEFSEEEFKPIETLIKHLIIRSENPIFKQHQSFPLSYIFLKYFHEYEGIYMTLSKQRQIYQYFTDNLFIILKEHGQFNLKKKDNDPICTYPLSEVSYEEIKETVRNRNKGIQNFISKLIMKRETETEKTKEARKSYKAKERILKERTQLLPMPAPPQEQQKEDSLEHSLTPPQDGASAPTERTLADAAAALSLEYNESSWVDWEQSESEFETENNSPPNSNNMYKIEKASLAYKRSKNPRMYARALESTATRAPVPIRTYGDGAEAEKPKSKPIMYQDVQQENFFDRPMPVRRRTVRYQPRAVQQPRPRSSTTVNSKAPTPRWSATTSEFDSRPPTGTEKEPQEPREEPTPPEREPSPPRSRLPARPPPPRAVPRMSLKPIEPALTPLTTRTTYSAYEQVGRREQVPWKRTYVAPKPTPFGQIKTKFTPWLISKRKTNRLPENRLAQEIPIDDLDKYLQTPIQREPYKTIYWTTTNFFEEAPRWASVPHNAQSITYATEQCPTSMNTGSDRFHSSVDLEIFPMDDNIYDRNIHFESFRHDKQWFCRIKEETGMPDGTTEISSINISWEKSDQFIDMLEQVLATPLPPAKEMAYVYNGTYVSKYIDDMKRKSFYYLDITQDTNHKGWLRYAHLTQETPMPNSQIVGEISFPWHKLNFFTERFIAFKRRTE